MSPARGLWSGGRLAAAREAGWEAGARAAGSQAGSTPRAVWLQREVAEKRRRERSEAAGASSPSSSAGRAKRASAAEASQWHDSTSPMSTTSEQEESGAARSPLGDEAGTLSPLAWSTPSDMRSEGGGEGGSPAREVNLAAVEAEVPEWVAADVACWNALGLRAVAADLRLRKYEGSASRAKLAWLSEWLRVERPFVVVLLEVDGCKAEMGCLRSWFARLGYLMAWSPGEGGEARCGKQLGAHANGIAVAVCATAGKLVALKRLAERAVGFSVRRKRIARLLHGGAIHGLHGVQRSEDDVPGEPPARSFLAQLNALRDWVQAQGGGLVLGDFNRVPCMSWREPRPSGKLSKDGEALQLTMGWRCSCCSPSGAVPSAGGLVEEAGGGVSWSHRSSSSQAKLDFGFAVGGGWGGEAVSQLVWAEDGGQRVGDHALLTLRVRLSSAGSRLGEDRPKPLPFKGRNAKGESARGQELFRQWWQQQEVAAGVRADALQAQQGRWASAVGGSGVAVYVKAIRGAAEAAMAEAAAEAERRQVLEACGGSTSAKQEYRSWFRRLEVAVRARREGTSTEDESLRMLFHAKAGLRELGERFAGAELLSKIIERCRRQVSRAGKRLSMRDRSGDRELAEGCKALAANPVDAGSRWQQVWRLLKRSGASIALDQLHVGDDAEAPSVGRDEPGFLELAGQIGDKIVGALDDGWVPAAFAAWFDVFKLDHDTLPGLDGGAWELSSELSFTVFLQSLRMARGKAVGAGGLSVEMLLEAGRDVQLGFYEALMADVKGGTLSPQWRVVLYALLAKPPPNDPTVVAERREIALMPQDMKIFLQMIRRTVYARVADRVAKEQYGWRQGVGCADPGLSLQVAVQQARRVGHPLYVLWIDLATFFPKIQRMCNFESEIRQGLPRAVAEIALDIYGRFAGDESVACQYDTDAGLGKPFHNHMGCLMGCPLSPDKAKLLLNSIIVAISLQVKGVQLWGEGAGDASRIRETLLQMAYADDWCGVFESAAQLRKAWDMWVVWEQAVGAKLGVKKLLKTVVSGVEWVDGKARTPADPKLLLADGKLVPFANHDVAYKHLGRLTRPDAVDSTAWKGEPGRKQKGLLGHCEAMLARLRQVRPGSMTEQEFCMVTDTLLGGVVGFYAQTLWVSFEEAEVVERKWRCIFNRKFKRDRSVPRAGLYERRADGSWRRRHVWGMALASLKTAVDKAMADVAPTGARAAARSSVALALERLGCRSDPRWWKWGHLRDKLEAKLRKGGVRYLGDAWALATMVLDGECDAGRHPEDALGDAAARRLGRWEVAGSLSPDDPLHPDAIHWRAPASALLFQPVEDGGLGAEPALELMERGVVAVEHLCKPALFSVGRQGAWIESFEEACARIPRLRATAEARREWDALMKWVADMGVDPVRPREVGDGLSYRSPAVRGFASGEAAGGGAEKRREAVAEAVRVRGRPEEEQGTREEWRERLVAAFGAPAVGREVWRHGGFDPAAAARGARVVVAVDQIHSLQAAGGEARYLLRPEVGAEGSFEGWEQRMVEWRERVSFDPRGMMCLDGVLLADEVDVAVAGLPPAIELAGRARLRLGEDVLVVERGLGVKRKETHVALDVQAEGLLALTELQARYQFSRAVATDAGRNVMRDADGKIERDKYGRAVMGASMAVVAHDGSVTSGHMYEPEATDNYAGELGAVLVALKEAPADGRMLVVVDATSPVTAWLRFRGVHDRIKCGYYIAAWLDTLDGLLVRQELVVFWWQTSHVGAPPNEWADVEATAAFQGDRLVVPRVAPTFFSLRPVRPVRSWFAWASERGARAVSGRLMEAVGETVMREPFDMDIGEVSDQASMAMRMVGAQRFHVGDRKRRLPKQVVRWLVDAGKETCVYGCDCVGTWSHFAFFCGNGPMAIRREELKVAVKQGIGVLGMDHVQLSKMDRWLREPVRRSMVGPRPGQTDFDLSDPWEAEVEKQLRRVAAGLVDGPVEAERQQQAGGSGARARHLAERAAGRKVAMICVEMQLQAKADESKWEREIQDKTLALQVLKRHYGGWAALMRGSGPARVAVLAGLRRARQRVQVAIIAEAASGRLAAGVAVAAARKRLAAAVRLARMRVEESHPRVEEEAVAQWMLLMFARRWRWRTAQRREVGLLEGTDGRWGHEWEVRTRVEPQEEELWTETFKDGRAYTGRPAGVWEFDQRRKLECGKPDGGGASQVLWWTQAGVRKEMWRAVVGWARESRVELRLLRAWREKKRRVKEVERMREAMANFVTSAAGTCSGKPAEPVGRHVRWERSGEGQVVRGPRVATIVRQAQEAAGLQADRGGRWRVQEVLDVRRREGTVAAWDVLVRWVGRHEDLWVVRSALSRPVQREVRGVIERRRQAAAKEREQGMEVRRATRAAQGKVGRGAAVGRARLRREGDRRSVRVRERAQREEASGSSEVESSDEGGSEEEDAASDGEEPSTPEGFFEVAELRCTRGKGASMQVLVRWKQEDAEDSWEPVQYLSEDQQRAARRMAGAARRPRRRPTREEVAAKVAAEAAEEAARVAEVEAERRRRRAVEVGEREKRRERREVAARERRGQEEGGVPEGRGSGRGGGRGGRAEPGRGRGAARAGRRSGAQVAPQR